MFRRPAGDGSAGQNWQMIMLVRSSPDHYSKSPGGVSGSQTLKEEELHGEN